MDIIAEIIRILKDHGCQAPDLNEMTEIDSLQMDSVSLTETLMEIENHFSVIIPDSAWGSWIELREVVEYIVSYLHDTEMINRPMG